jgi:[ribosomal protein S5]-alanine N-acetyltransferase
LLTIQTSRLDLVPATLGLIKAELDSPAHLAKLLNARIPEGWPPGEYDLQAMEYFRDRLTQAPADDGWYSWYGVLRPPLAEGRVLVAAAGFFGPPTVEKVVEVGYSVVPAFEGQGYATELVCALAGHAFSTGQVMKILAHTATTNIPSMRVLEKAGFLLVGQGDGPANVEYAREYHAFRSDMRRCE